MKTNLSPKRAFIAGALWTVGTRWSIKFIGFVSTVVMARLLVPADYGLVAMAMLLVGLVQATLDFGATTALLRTSAATRSDIDSAWTLGVIEGVIIALVLLGCAPLATAYFEEPRVAWVLYVFAGCVSVAYCGNVGLVLAQRDFNFSLGFRHALCVKLLGVFVTILAGVIFRDYRALVIGIATGYLSGFVLSYLMHPYRPRWDLSGIPKIWALTKWLMLAGVGGFALRKGDELLAARVGSPREFGLYTVGSDLGQLPTGELGPAMLRAFLPVLSAIQNDIARTNAAVIKTVATVNTITLPVGIGFAAIASPATLLILGSSWVEAVGFVAVFALVGCLQILVSPLATLLTLRGHTRLQSRLVWFEFVFFLIGVGILAPGLGLIGLAWARVVACISNALATTWMARRWCDLSWTLVAHAVGRPLLGSFVMYALISKLLPLLFNSVVGLVLCICFGMLFFGLWSLTTWLWTGRPEGLESTVYDQWLAWRTAREASSKA